MNPLAKPIDLHPETIDLFFVQSDLKEVYMTNAEQDERAAFDSMCGNIKIDDNTPLGKQVR